MGEFLFVIAIMALLAWPVYELVLEVLKWQYFASDEFLDHKKRVASVAAEHNEVAKYVSEIRSKGSFTIGSSLTGRDSHLAVSENTSKWNYRRDRNVPNYQARNVHNCSLQVVRNAQAQPIKYFMKYFGVKAEESHLAAVEKLGEDIARLENALRNLKIREESITKSISPPAFIVRRFQDQLLRKVGVELSPIKVPYPVYQFEYVSAGGNSSERSIITLDTPTIDRVVETLAEKIRWKKSAAGQRALMTSRLREQIKRRDKYTCRFCSVSISKEPTLLLEVDHIIPVSKGGLSTHDNLQTLCWRCNRTKSNKVAS